jgi:hypothetical protein
MRMARSNRTFTRSVPSALAIGLIALAQPAFAEDAPAPAPAPEAATAPVEVQPAAATDPAAPIGTEATVTDAAPVEEAPAPRYPRSVIARPLTLPKNVAMIGADTLANKDFSAMLAAPIVGFGITDKLEVLVPYTFATRELEAKGSLGVDVGYAVLRGALDGKFEAIARIRGGYDTLASDALPLQIGLHAQYNITPKIAVISGVPGAQQLSIALAENADMATPVTFGLPIGVGVQPTDELYLQVDTKLATFNISDSANTFIGADSTPAALTAVYNVINALDIQAAIGTDLNAASDSLSFLLGFRYFAGQL